MSQKAVAQPAFYEIGNTTKIESGLRSKTILKIRMATFPESKTSMLSNGQLGEALD